MGGQQMLIDKETPLHVSHTHTHAEKRESALAVLELMKASRA